MDAQLKQLIECQAEQNRILTNQLQWLKFSLLALLLLATASCCCLGFLIHERGNANSKFTVVATEPILEHSISLAENDTIQFQFPTISLAENGATQSQFGNRITVPPMTKAAFIELDFSAVVSEAEYTRRGSRSDGMCL
jgi:hypothetical protein